MHILIKQGVKGRLHRTIMSGAEGKYDRVTVDLGQIGRFRGWRSCWDLDGRAQALVQQAGGGRRANQLLQLLVQPSAGLAAPPPSNPHRPTPRLVAAQECTRSVTHPRSHRPGDPSPRGMGGPPRSQASPGGQPWPPGLAHFTDKLPAAFRDSRALRGAGVVKRGE